jgi:hypothetical protein
MGRNLPLRGRLRALVHGRSARDEAVEAAGGSHVGGSRSNEPTQSRAAAAAAADGSPHRHLALGEYSVPQGTYTVRIRYRGWFLGVSDRVRREEGVPTYSQFFTFSPTTTTTPTTMQSSMLSKNALRGTTARTTRVNVSTRVMATSRVDRCSKDEIMVAPSILSANFSRLGEQVREACGNEEQRAESDFYPHVGNDSHVHVKTHTMAVARRCSQDGSDRRRY